MLTEPKTESRIRREIRKRINYISDLQYDGFDMSGYNDSAYQTMEILGRFKDLTFSEDDTRDSTFVTLQFWKGSHRIIRITHTELVVLEDWSGGETTEDLIFKVLTYQNPNLILDSEA